MVWRARLHHCLSARGCIVAHCECESGAVTSGSVVAAQACEGELCLVSVYHDEDCVHFVSVMVVVVSAVFDVGVHDAGGVVAALVGVFEVVPAVHASHAAFVAFDGERVTVVEGKGGGAYFVIADGNAGDVAASQNLRVFFCLAVLVEDSVVVQAVGGVHVFYCSTHTTRVSTCVDTRIGVFCRWSEVGWLFPARLGVCLPVGARGLGICGRLGGVVSCLVLCGRGIGVVGVWVASRERACLREVCGRVGDMEGVSLLE